MLFYLGLALSGCNQEASVGDTELDMGRAPLRRLNRDEYANSLRDLFGTETNAKQLLPADEEAFDFLVIADAHTVSPYHIESYELAIDEAITDFLGLYESNYRVEAEGDWASPIGGEADGNGYWVSPDGIAVQLDLNYSGTYELEISGYAWSGFTDVDILHNGQVVATEVVFNAASPDFPQLRTFEVEVERGVHSFEIRNEGTGSPAFDYIQLHGPLGLEFRPSPTYDAIVSCDLSQGDGCVDEVLTNFLTRAWRRPIESSDLAWARSLYQLGYDATDGTPSEGLRVAFKGALLAPDFLYREEVGADEGQPPRPLSGVEVANRLSFFLWSSAPDEELLTAATAGELTEPEGIEAQVQRMLRDPRADALVDTFAAQWFDIDTLDRMTPEPTIYRDFDEELRAALIEEMRALSRRFLTGEISMYELLTLEETVANARLAGHYRLPYVGSGWQTIETDISDRRGLLGTGGWLMAHSHPGAPSVVQRGKWVLGRLLCDAPPLPPPDVNQDLELQQAVGSVRLQEEAQRGVEPCHTCHQVMDPIGHAMGAFDVTGGERRFDELGYRIDTQVAIGGDAQGGLADVAHWVAEDPRLPRCVVEQTFMFALGRPASDLDDNNLDAVTRRFLNNGAMFPSLVEALTTHSVFRHRGAIPVEDLQ